MFNYQSSTQKVSFEEPQQVNIVQNTGTWEYRYQQMAIDFVDLQTYPFKNFTQAEDPEFKIQSACCKIKQSSIYPDNLWLGISMRNDEKYRSGWIYRDSGGNLQSTTASSNYFYLLQRDLFNPTTSDFKMYVNQQPSLEWIPYKPETIYLNMYIYYGSQSDAPNNRTSSTSGISLATFSILVRYKHYF